MRITLRQLEVFAAIARHRSVSRGASDVCLSQSAASMALQQLEDSLQVQLFHRHGKQLSLNENGRRIQPAVSSLLQMAVELEEVASERSHAGTLRVAASASVGGYMLGEVCREFKDRFPEANLILKVVPGVDVINEIDCMSCDIGIIESNCNRASISVEQLFSEELCIFASRDHPLGKAGRITIEDLDDEPWCLMQMPSNTRTTLTTSMPKRLLVALETNSVSAIIEAVKAGCGLGCLSGATINHELDRGEIVRLTVEDLHLERNIHMITPRNVYKGSLKEGFEEIARRHLSKESVFG